MIAKRSRHGRIKVLGIASLFCLNLLAACGKPVAPVARVEQSANPCPVPHAGLAGKLSKNDEDLFAAVAAGDVLRVERSIVEGANVNTSGMLKRTPLFTAAFCDRAEVAKLLLDRGSQANVKDANGMSSLHMAVIIGAAETAKVLIGKGADIDIRDLAGRTPLHVAAATNQISMVELLLERGADNLARDRGGFTPASLASENGHTKLGAMILKRKEKQRALH